MNLLRTLFFVSALALTADQAAAESFLRRVHLDLALSSGPSCQPESTVFFGRQETIERTTNPYHFVHCSLRSFAEPKPTTGFMGAAVTYKLSDGPRGLRLLKLGLELEDKFTKATFKLRGRGRVFFTLESSW